MLGSVKQALLGCPFIGRFGCAHVAILAVSVCAPYGSDKALTCSLF